MLNKNSSIYSTGNQLLKFLSNSTVFSCKTIQQFQTLEQIPIKLEINLSISIPNPIETVSAIATLETPVMDYNSFCKLLLSFFFSELNSFISEQKILEVSKNLDSFYPNLNKNLNNHLSRYNLVLNALSINLDTAVQRLNPKYIRVLQKTLLEVVSIVALVSVFYIMLIT